MQTEQLLDIRYGDHRVSGMGLLYKEERQMPDTVDLSIYRYDARAVTDNHSNDHGIINYYNSSIPLRQNKSLSLKFCLHGNCYCPKDCTKCTVREECSTVDVFEFQFNPFFLKKMVPGTSDSMSKREKVLAFKYPNSFTRNIPVEDKKRSLLNFLLDFEGHGDSLDNLLLHSKVNELLLYSMEALQDDQDDTMVCPLSIEADFVNRLFDAKQILMENISSPMTIKELSRKVAMNECYLKKGFKNLFGTTIFEFYQKERMAHAQYLLYEKGLNVTEVSELLGYSSISHFSTAFKKFTGLRPCELLFKA
ncbi:MAG: AraC family transcriptional regulator [Chitinophagaceae bacterium]